MAMGLFQSIDWLTKKIKSLCCWLGIIEEQIGATLPYIEIGYEAANGRTLNDWNQIAFRINDGTGADADFTSVVVIGKDIARLYGSSGNLQIRNGAFNGSLPSNVLYIEDPFGLITSIGDESLKNNTSLVLVYLPAVKTIGSNTFTSCTALTTIYIPKCTSLGPTVSDDQVFNGISGNNISLKIDPSRLTCDNGSPDGDVYTLQTNNTVAIL